MERGGIAPLVTVVVLATTLGTATVASVAVSVADVSIWRERRWW